MLRLLLLLGRLVLLLLLDLLHRLLLLILLLQVGHVACVPGLKHLRLLVLRGIAVLHLPLAIHQAPVYLEGGIRVGLRLRHYF